MLLLTLRTDKPEAELALYEDDKKVDEFLWQAHRQLAETIHIKINELLSSNDKSLRSLNGLVIFKGPGSFTGLRIGFSVANTMSAGLVIPIVSASGADWQHQGIRRLLKGENESIAVPEYGAPAKTTQPKK
jgi:tRNA threonylcarbamoyladenosine biosynthesis protein TsaB